MLKKRTPMDWVADTVIHLLMIVLIIVTAYPLYYVLMCSLSNPDVIAKFRGLIFWPKQFTLIAYEKVLSDPAIMIGFKNTLIYVLVGTAINIFLTILGGYTMSRKQAKLAGPAMILIVITMFFNGGLIPTYLLVSRMGLRNTLWAVTLPTAISAYNLIIMRTAFSGLPISLEEAAKIDGANDFTVLFKIFVPLAMPTIAVMLLFYGVSNWNSYFNAMIYLSDRSRFPIQLILREILIVNATDSMTTDMTDKAFIGETIKYATVIVSMVPILVVYPYLQKYFTSGVMIGAVKG